MDLHVALGIRKVIVDEEVEVKENAVDHKEEFYLSSSKNSINSDFKSISHLKVEKPNYIHKKISLNSSCSCSSTMTSYGRS